MSAVNAPERVFETRYEPPARACARIGDAHLLALIGFDGAGADYPDDPGVIRVSLPQLGQEPLCEVWTSARPVTRDVAGDVAFARTEDLVFGHVEVAETPERNIEQAARHAYGAVIEFTRAVGFPHFLRIWNYIPDINVEQDRLERYKSFCIGRHVAFENAGLERDLLPAASGVGAPRGGLLVYFLAAREPGHQIENPRQVSAFDYPSRYGPRSPAFSRAVTKRWGDEQHLYISGTASIVGHESRHDDDVVSQLDETLDNVDRLIGRASEAEGLGIGTAADLSMLKIYVRHAPHAALVRTRIQERIGRAVPAVYLRGDLCRRDLLLELEGLYTGP
ncbi:MAG: hypothetical protein R3286_05075 [Gammaproteobacteria bacterium]|nr:hypothetical protein [Gammaproteobacteria bacterium]